MPTAFVTGAGDFVGLNIIEALRDADWEVIGLAGPRDHTEYLDRMGIEYAQGDISSLSVVRRHMPAQVDAVFHAVHHVSLWSCEAAEQTRANVQATQAMIEVALEKKVKRFIHTSSIVTYGLHGGTVTEDTPSRASSSPINFLRSKARAEQAVRQACGQGLNAVILNPANMIGAYDFHGWARLFSLVHRGRMPIMAPGGGSFCHPRAMAEAQISAVERGEIGGNYLLGGEDITYLELLQAIGRLMNRHSLPRAVPPGILRGLATLDEGLSGLLGRRPTMTRETVELLSSHTYCDSARAQSELGYRPQPLQQMLQDCLDWLQEEDLLDSA